jgi:hypothetical protein
MTIQDTFMLGTSVGDLQSMDELGITTGDPDASYRPFSVVDKLGDMSDEGNGFPVVTWHYAGLYPGEADIFYDFLNGNISASVVFRTRLNRLNGTVDDYLWATFSGLMSWMTGDEQNPALHTLDVTITFTGLILIPDYP